MPVTPVAATDSIPLVAADGFTGQNNARDIRLWIQSLITSGSSTMSTRDGVLVRGWSSSNYTSGRVAAAGGSNTIITVQPAYCIITRSGQASYLWMLETATNVTLSNANVTNPRIDIICATQYDQVAFAGDAQHGAYLTVVEGTASGTPVVPSTPAGSIKLAEVLRPANNNTTPGTITDKRQSTALHGSVRQMLPGDAASDAGLYHGELRDNAGTISRWDAAQTVWSVLAAAGQRDYAYAELQRTDGTYNLNSNSATLLSCINTATTSGWITNYAGRGLQLNKAGLYEVIGALYTGGSGVARYESLQVNSTTPSWTRVIGAGTENSGYGFVGGSTHVLVPNGSVLQLTFDAYSNTTNALTMNNGTGQISYVSVVRIGEAI